MPQTHFKGVVPAPDQWSAPFWEGCKEGKLVILRCQDCGYYNHPPTFMCLNCKNVTPNLRWEQVSGRGTIYSFNILYDTALLGVKDPELIPILLIELEEQRGLLMFSNPVDMSIDEVKVGVPVEVTFDAH